MRLTKRSSLYVFLVLIAFQSYGQDKGNIEIYGQIMTDAGYNFNSIDPNWFDVMRPSKLPSRPQQFGPDGNTYFSVRQTKIGIKTSTPTRLGELKTHFDFDLFGFGKDIGQTTFHVVNAYAQLGKIGAGQTASPFMDLDVMPVTLEYWGPLSRVFYLNLQVRFVAIEKKDKKLIIAIERPGGTADGGDEATTIQIQHVQPVFQVPNLSAQFRRGWNKGYIQVAGLLKCMKWKDTTSAPQNFSGSTIGWGFNLGSVINLGDRLKLKNQVVFGSGIENYIADVTPDVALESQSGPFAKGKALPVWGFFSFAEIKWTEKLSSSVGYSMVDIQNTNLQAAEAFRRGQYGLINLRYFPVANLMAGIEYQYGRRDNFSDGFHSVGNKIQFTTKWTFSLKTGSD